jgi:hypothetical protein
MALFHLKTKQPSAKAEATPNPVRMANITRDLIKEPSPAAQAKRRNFPSELIYPSLMRRRLPLKTSNEKNKASLIMP